MPDTLPMIFNGLLSLSWWQLVLVVLALTHVTIAAVTIFLHRHQAHRALDLHPAVSHFFRFWLWLTTGMVAREWVSIHRKHHALCETPEDPHSPQVKGIRKVLFEGAELYRAASRDASIMQRYGHGTPDDWLERHLYTPHDKRGIVIMLAIDVLLFGVAGVAVWAVQMIWIPFFAAGVINGLGHYWGYRNYPSPDAATNISPWGILIGGEELHNNHHAFPGSARLSSRTWEFDIGWLYIRLLAMLKLARVKKVAPRLAVVAGKEAIDMETVRAVVVSRMHVLARYAREVLLPVSRSELDAKVVADRSLLRRLRRLVARDESLLDEVSRRWLTQVQERSQALKTVFQHQRQLRQIWERTAASQEALLGALQDWCRQAEASGIQSLQDFARSLRGYTLQPAV